MQPYQGYDDPNKRKTVAQGVRNAEFWLTAFFVLAVLALVLTLVLVHPLRAIETFAVTLLITSPFWGFVGLKFQQFCGHGWAPVAQWRMLDAAKKRRVLGIPIMVWVGSASLCLASVYTLNALLDTSTDEPHQLTVTGKDYRTGRHGDRTYYAIVPTFTDGQLSKLGLGGDGWALDREEHITLSKEEYDRVLVGQTQASFVIRHGFFDIPWVVRSGIDTAVLPVPVATPATPPKRWDTIPLLPSEATPPTPEQSAKYNAQQKYQQGVAYAFGRGVPKNEVLAVQLLQQAAETGHAEAQHMMGYMISNGLGGLPQDWTKANEWVRKAADQGLAAAQDDLGVSYGDGRGVAQDWVQSYKWIRLAANQGNAQAIQDLDYAKARMTPAQLEEAEALAKAWQPHRTTVNERPY